MNKQKILFVLGLSAAIVSLAQSLYVPLLPDMQRDLHTSLSMANLTVTLFTIAMAVMQVVLGPVVDRNGRKKILIPGMIIYVLATIGCTFSFSIEMLLIFRIIQGIGAAAVPLVAATMIGDVFEGKKRAESMATYQMILGISPAIGPLIGGLIGSVFGYSGTFVFAAASAVIIMFIALFVLPETKPTTSTLTGKQVGLNAFRRIFQSKTGRVVLLSGFVLYDVFYTFIVFLPMILESQYDLGAANIGFFSLALMAFNLVGSKLSGRLQSKIGTVKSLLWVSSSIVGCLVIFIFAAKLSLITLLLALMLTGFVNGLAMPVMPTLLSAEFVQERATAMGVYNFVRYLGMAAAPMIGSVLYLVGGTDLLIGVTAVFVGAVVIVTRQLLPSKGKQRA
ncbi:multidrug resistance protein [Paenibacillus cellulosilyticus]|uniref:Multidrug resistance protein n=1 Tax=Paenibacillus cellulosilyticus TaxID=375489 RepID=A0A2V2YCG1_9BACL|nr:MFS transporter [Paenibacillus cellulosilyticus]PWV89413.1 multidrug resistance protein [Paenibacillus cellulosilyticus]QKS47296.1 MFS transporter [Paenibacillus cellulosilyticus]